jgi:hypothetical protein
MTDKMITITTLRLPNTVKVRADVDLMAKKTLKSVVSEYVNSFRNVLTGDQSKAAADAVRGV